MTFDLSSLSDISALIRGQDVGSGIRRVSVDAIQPDPNQPRKAFEEESLNELAQSIQSIGIIQPPVVRTHNNCYMLISGERRWRAARHIGLKQIDIIVRDDLSARAQLVENIHREALSAWEIYRVIASELDAGAKQVDLAEAFGKSKQWVEGFAAVRKMPEHLLELLKANRVADITVMSQLARLERDMPDIATSVLECSGVITRGMIADAMNLRAQRPAVTVAPAVPDISDLSTDSPVVATSPVAPPKRAVERSKNAGAPLIDMHPNSSQALPVLIRAYFDNACWIVNYAEQHVDTDGIHSVLLEGEEGRKCYGPLEALTLKSIECC